MPCVRIVDFSAGRKSISKYRFVGEVGKAADIVEFVSAFEFRKLREYKKSQGPEKNAGEMRQVTRKSFKEDIEERKQDVLLFVQAPDALCRDCSGVRAILLELGRKKKGLVLGSLDTLRNEIDDWVFNHYPEIILFPVGSDPVEYSGPLTKEGIEAFLHNRYSLLTQIRKY